MHPNETKFMEHLAFRAELSLEELCEMARVALELPLFRYDNENETEWGIAVKDEVEYNLSRPYKEGTLQRWDDTVPPGCNFGMILIIPYTSSRTLNTTIWHHRRWPGQNVPQQTSFRPNS